MCKDVLTYNIAIEALRDFFREKPFVFFGTGMSCALDNRFGMDALRDVLIHKMNEHRLRGTQQEEWNKVMHSLRRGADLESALNEVSDYALLQKITSITGCFVASVDREYAFRIANGEIEWPATSFLKRLVDRLPEGDRVLHVLTTNYDMLFEYACDRAGILYTNGFVGGVERRTDWDAVERTLLFPERFYQRGRIITTYKKRKHVRLYKVHGSLNYFFHQGAVIENNAWMWNPPDFAQRVMITPGLSKYETLQRYRQELLSKADTVIEREHHFLFLGYGFNDKHIEEYIKRKLVNQDCPGLIITRDSNPRIESLLSQAANLWLVCKSQEVNSNGTRIFNRRHANWVSLPEKVLWDISQFTKEVLGG
ncbi:MAG: SIR2 family protein [Bacillota bacterium]